MELPDLTDLTVNEQKDELENLSKKQLKELREEEERQTAIDNIDSELSNRDDEVVEEAEVVDESVPDEAATEHVSDTRRVEKLEAKVDYIIERCKTISEEGFENYEN